MKLYRHLPIWLLAWTSAIAYVLLAAALIYATPAHSAEHEGTSAHAYAEVFGGYALPDEADVGKEARFERTGEFTAGGGAGYVFDSGIHLGGKLQYFEHGCDDDAARNVCVNTSALGLMATAGYTLETGLFASPFVEADGGIAREGVIYGGCAGLKSALTPATDVLVDTCWHRVDRTEAGLPEHLDTVTAGVRLRYRL